MGGDLRQEIGALGPRRRHWAAGRSRNLLAHRRGGGVRPVVSSRPRGSRAAPFWIAAYLQRYGEASIDADFTSRVVDLVHEGFDLALRVGQLADWSLAARRLGELTYGLFAADSYLARRGAPKSLGALDRHALVMFTGGGFRAGWRLADAHGEALIEGPWRLRVNNAFAARDAAAAGLGIALLPELVARGTPLVRVLPKIAGPRVPFHAVFPSARFLAPKVRAFVDLARQLGA